MRNAFLGRAFGALALLIGAVTAPSAAQQLAGRPLGPVPAVARADTNPTADVLGTVTDSSTGAPLAGSEIQIIRNGQVIARAETDRLGAYRIHAIPVGRYAVEVRLIGFQASTRQVDVGQTGGTMNVSFQLTPAQIQLSAITVAATPLAVDTRTGDQVFKQDEFQGSPMLTTSQIVQQAIAGAARAPTGEVHIRGQHAEYTYYIDGVPVPPGISGSLN